MDGADGVQGCTPSCCMARERGVALLIVIVFVALTSILVTNLAYSTFMQAESLGMVERRLKGEYVLKSLVNFAAALIALNDPNVDSPQDPAGMFYSGREIPPDLAQQLGVTDPETRVALEIAPQTGKFRIDRVLNPGTGGPGGTDTPTKKYREMCLRLFKVLRLDEIKEPDMSGLSATRTPISTEQMVSNLIDYLDTDQESFQGETLGDGSRLPPGMEGQLKNKSVFANAGKLDSLDELAVIPGFTPTRRSRLLPFITKEDKAAISINSAPAEVLQALDPEITAEVAQAIIAYRMEKGPFQQVSDLQNVPGVPAGLTSKLGAGYVTTVGRYYNVLGRVAYGTQAPMFIKASIRKGSGPGDEPQIISSVLY